MRRVVPDHEAEPDFWYVPGGRWDQGFCKCAADSRPELRHLYLVTDPALALTFWKGNDFRYLVEWAEAGFPGPCFITKGDIWILSPDPGKEIDGDS